MKLSQPSELPMGSYSHVLYFSMDHPATHRCILCCLVAENVVVKWKSNCVISPKSKCKHSLHKHHLQTRVSSREPAITTQGPLRDTHTDSCTLLWPDKFNSRMTNDSIHIVFNGLWMSTKSQAVSQTSGVICTNRCVQDILLSGQCDCHCVSTPHYPGGHSSLWLLLLLHLRESHIYIVLIGFKVT